MQPRVQPAAREQLRMRAAFGDLALVEDHYAVRVLDGGEPVGDDQRRTALHQVLQSLLHQAFGSTVQSGGGFVEDQYRCVLVQGTCDRQPLPLAARERHGVMAYDGVQSLGQGRNQVTQIGGLDALQQAPGIGRASQRDVGGEGIVEHHDILADQCELAAQGIQPPVGDVVAIQRQPACTGQDETWQQIGQRGLAGTGWADHGDDLAGLDCQRHAVERGRAVLAVAHRDRLQRDAALRSFARIDAAGFGRRVLDQAHGPLHCSQAPGDRARDFGQALDGRDEHQHRRDEGCEGPDSDAFAALPQRDGDHHRQRGRGKHVSERRDRRRRHGGLHAQAAQRGAEPGEPAGLHLLRAMQADYAGGQDVLLDDVRQVVGGRLSRASDAIEAARHGPDEPGHGRHDQEHDQGQLPVQVQQIGQECDQGNAVLEQANHGVDQHRGAVLHLEHHGIRQCGGVLFAKQGKTRVEQPGEHIAAQRQQPVLGDLGQRQVGQKPGQAPDSEQEQQTCRDHPQGDSAGLEAAIEQWFEQGRRERLGGRCDHGREHRRAPSAARAAKIGSQPAQGGQVRPDHGVPHPGQMAFGPRNVSNSQTLII
jgi:hypothetical protein